MNVLIIKGSPHEKGTTSLLAKKFEEGARAAGHVVQELSLIHISVWTVPSNDQKLHRNHS